MLAVLSLFVSAVSACACSHHQPEKTKAETSCHGISHESNNASVQSEIKSDVIDVDCSCFLRTQVPAIVAKTDDKRTTIEKQVPDSETAVSIEFILATVRIDPPSISQSSASSYKEDPLSSLPARAPPRL